ncbi:hypothetical protein ARNL5_03622 [Anaerolineae bacterium]|nr:hypothetical protein ARNL5_03622 [Anaerolineae bacterium]
MWQNQVVPSRAAQQAYQYQDVVYVPSFSKVYLFASKNGHLLSELKIQEVIDYWDDFVLTMWGDNKIDLHKTGTDDIVATLSLDNQRLIPEYRRALFKFTYRFGDVLIVYSNYNPAQIQAFRLTDGQLIWEREEPYISRPIIFNNRLAVMVNDTIQFYDLLTGKVQGYLQLVRIARESVIPANNTLRLAWIAASKNLIGVYLIDTAELLAIEVDLTDFEK